MPAKTPVRVVNGKILFGLMRFERIVLRIFGGYYPIVNLTTS